MNEQDLLRCLEKAIAVAKDTGALLKKGLLNNQHKNVHYKGEINLVTEMDRCAEEMIRKEFATSFPDISMLGEEGGESGDFSGTRWIVDPLDGTTSYSHGLPHYSTSIALEIDGEISLGVVYNPCLDESFSAIRGQGAFLNGHRIVVSKTDSLKKSLLATGFPYDRATSDKNNVDHFNAFILKIQGIRRLGSAALDFCYTAAGRFDGYWERKLSPWDSAAGSIILREAGGVITDFSGKPFSIYGEEVLASNGMIHNKMIETLKGS